MTLMKGGDRMKIKFNIKSICVYSVIILLTIALSASFYVIGNKNETIKENKNQITEITKQLDEAKNEIAEKDKANGELSQKLQQAETEKNNLQKENSNLKTEIEKLNAKKLVEAEKLTALQNSPQAAYPPATKVCYLTFDDGPSDNTLKILDILDRYNAKATFFVIGTTGKLDYVKQIHAKGHTVGLHTDTHQIYTTNKNVNIYASSEAYFRDLDAISNKVEQLIGIKSKVIRFPGGSSNAVSKKVCAGIMTTLTRQVKAKGYAYFDWNVSSGDAESNKVPASKIVSNVLNASKNKDSICVLMHDTAVKTTTVQALPAIIEGLASMGYRFEGLTEKSNGYWHPINN